MLRLDCRAEPSHLTTLARILLYNRTISSSKLALSIFTASSDLGDEHATFIMIDEGLKHGRPQDLKHPKLRAPLSHLKKLAEAKNLVALVLLARTLELEGDLQTSLKLFQRAIAVARDPRSNSEARDNATLSEAWKGAARLARKLNHASEEQVAWESAALQCDDPEAFFELAIRKNSQLASKNIEYLQKAAISGVGDAAFELGMAYCSSLETAAEKEGSVETMPRINARTEFLEQYEMIKEWFSIAVESEKCRWRGQARLQGARVMRKLGHFEKSLTWLELALQEMQIRSKKDQLLCSKWQDSEFDPTSRELERMLAEHP